MHVIADVETYIDKDFLLSQECPNATEETKEAQYLNYIQGLREKQGVADPWINTAYHRIATIAAGPVDNNYQLGEVKIIPGDNEAEIARNWWQRLEKFQMSEPRGILVTFNGRRFDVPILELAAFRHGIPIGFHFSQRYGSRYRFQMDWHWDLWDFLGNTGAQRAPSLKALCAMLGVRAKWGVDGSSVQALWEAGKLAEIQAYCHGDVIATYKVFIAALRMRGMLPEGWVEQARLGL